MLFRSDDDLNTAVALAAVFDLIKSSNTALDREALGIENRAQIAAWFANIDERLGIVPPLEIPRSDDHKIEIY